MDDLQTRAEAAADFVITQYGQNVIERMAQLAYSYHERSENAKTAEEAYWNVSRAAGVREAMALITDEAALIHNKAFEQMAQAEKEQEANAQITP